MEKLYVMLQKKFDDNEIMSIDMEINNNLEKIKNKELKPKEFLEDLWNNHNYGPYHEVDTATKIAKNMERGDIEKHQYIMSLLQKIANHKENLL
jgi:hypothetical protein